MSTLVALILWLAITSYAVLGGADYGAGFWDLTAGSLSLNPPLSTILSRSECFIPPSCYQANCCRNLENRISRLFSRMNMVTSSGEISRSTFCLN